MNVTQRACIPAIFVLVLACGSTPEADTPNRVSSINDAATRDASVSTNDGGEPPVDANDDRLYPLDVGWTWTWDVTSVGAGYAFCPAGTRKAEIRAKENKGGREAFLVQGFCSGVPASYVAEDSKGIVGLYNGAWATLLLLPPTDGATWTYFNASYRWRKEGKVTVKAGAFDSCWTAVQVVGYLNETTYCPGVGAVRVQFADLMGNGWKGEVSSFSAP